MSQVFARHAAEFTLLVEIDCGLGGLEVMRGTSLDLDKAQNLALPANEINFSSAPG